MTGDYVDFSIKQGDKAPAISAILKDKTGAPIDLTGKQVTFKMRSFIDGSLMVNDTANPDPDQSANKGKVTYAWQTGDTAAPGYAYAEWELLLAPGSTQTFPTIGWHLISVESDLDGIQPDRFANIRTLRRMVAEPSRDNYSDALMDALLLSNFDDLNVTAAVIWREKASEAAHLVDVSQGGSSRKLGSLYDRFIKQAEIYENYTGVGLVVSTPSAAVVTQIERP